MPVAPTLDNSALIAPGVSLSVDQVLSPYVYVFYVAFIVTFLFTPVMRHVALFYNVVDKPDLARKLHKTPVAYLGGIAVFLGWMGGLAISQFLTTHRVEADVRHLRWPHSIFVAAGLIVLLGLWDDIKKASPRFKIIAQVLAAVALLHAEIGTHITGPLIAPVLNWIKGHYNWEPSSVLIAHFVQYSSYLLTILLVVGCCNATNLMDGLDGLCSGVSAIVAIGFVFLSVYMAMIGNLGTTNVEGIRIALSLALLGAVLGFLPHNFNPASIFLGDTGSLFIGFCSATLIIMMAELRPKWFLGATVMFALPALDTALAFARRWVARRPFFSPDRQHIHHQLVARGFTVRQTVMLSYAITAAFVLLGGAMVYLRTRYVVAFYLVVFGFIIVAAFKTGMVHELEVPSQKPRTLSDSANVAAGHSDLDSDSVLRIPDEKSDKFS